MTYKLSNISLHTTPLEISSQVTIHFGTTCVTSHPKKEGGGQGQIFWFPTCQAPPNPTTHHSFFTYLLLSLTGSSLPYFSFLSFSPCSFSVQHSSSLLQTLLPAPPYHHFHDHFSDKITGKFLGTHKHLHILFLR